jgi:glycine/D-amino acid oxidase-like deaminating enzyme
VGTGSLVVTGCGWAHSTYRGSSGRCPSGTCSSIATCTAAGLPAALVDTVDRTAPRSVLRTPNRAFACGLHVVPRGDGQVYVGATNVISPDPRQTALVSDVLFLLECGVRQVRRNLGRSGLRRIQVGNRPVALDGMPLLGETDWTACG